MKMTRKDKAKQLLTLLQRGPTFSEWHVGVIDQSPSAQFKRWSQCWVLPLLEDLVPELKPRFEPIPVYGTKYTVSDFRGMVAERSVTKSDGFGKWATAVKMSDQTVDMAAEWSQPTWATHVVWFNK